MHTTFGFLKRTFLNAILTTRAPGLKCELKKWDCENQTGMDDDLLEIEMIDALTYKRLDYNYNYYDNANSNLKSKI